MSTATIAERVRAAVESGTPLRIRGAGTWLDAGRPVAARETLSTADESGIVEYVPGDLTMTARAGSSLEDLDRAARKNGQWLPLSPWGTSDATLGATIATATAGPYSAAFGLPRDVVLGLEFVTGTGDVVRSGGRVVKNVAGFDLTRLLTGSWGTLGVITEATVRLRALPQQSRVVTIRVDDAALADTTAAIRKLPFAPFACELLNVALARHLGLPASPTLLIELGGNAAALAAQLDLVRGLGSTDEAPDGVLDKLRTADRDVATTWRVSGKPTQFAALWAETNALPDSFMHGSAVRGVIRVLARSLLPTTRGHSGRIVHERLAADAWASLQVPAADRLAEDVRAKFDPARVLNPGILGAAA